MDETNRDVLVSATWDDLAHKRPETLTGDEEAYWRVSGTPRQTAPGQRVWFADEDRIIAWGEITALADGRLWFDGAHETTVPLLDDPPARGFTYIYPLAPRLREDDWEATIAETITTREALGGHDPDALDDETVADFVGFERDNRQREIRREIARVALDESTLPEATSLLWVDRAEVYTLCGGCFHADRDAMWTGSTENPNYNELREHMHEQLDAGTPCTNCKTDRINELAHELADPLTVEVTVADE
mgnify:CR=1 FL=1